MAVLLSRRCTHRFQVRQAIPESLYLSQDSQPENIGARGLPVRKFRVTRYGEKMAGEVDDRLAEILAIRVIDGGCCCASQLPNSPQRRIVLPAAGVHDDEITHSLAMLGRDEDICVRHRVILFAPVSCKSKTDGASLWSGVPVPCDVIVHD